MKAILRYLGGRLHRRMFVGFGITIFVTFLAVGLAMHSFSAATPSGWEQEISRVSRFVGRRFQEVWSDRAARTALATSVAEELEVQVKLQDARGQTFETIGPKCRRGGWSVPVRDAAGATIGRVRFCVPRRGGPGGARLALSLAILGLVVWLGSGLIARRITRPLSKLARVTEDIGAGRLDARAHVPGDDEVAHLAARINEMAGRIHTQIEDQRTLLATVSHELRTPLGHLRLLTEIAQSEELSTEDRVKALADIDAEVQEMDSLVAELLASSRLDFQSLAPQPLQPLDIARRALERAGLPAERLRIDGALPEVSGDATLLARAVSNLIRNAETHGGGLVHLRVRARDEGVAFEVEDAGPGIAPEEREAVFRPFHRAAGTERGTLGLGLALVARIAEVHGGRAYVEAPPGGGAVVGFTCRLL